MKDSPGVSGPAIRIAVWSISLGIAIMILSISIVRGFKAQISEKVTGFGAHIQISRFDLNQSYEPHPVEDGDSIINSLSNFPGIVHVAGYAIKPGIAKTDEAIEGVVLKGVDSRYNWDFFQEKLIRGTLPAINDSLRSDDIIISSLLASRIQVDTGSTLFMYFIQNPPRIRKFKISGIYNSGLEEMDRIYILGDIGHVRRLNDWNEDLYSGIEVYINDFERLEQSKESIEEDLPMDLQATTIRENYPQIFDWLNLQDTNEKVILILMLAVAIINMITALLILILDKTTLIGVLKSMGMNNSQVRTIFMYKAGYLISRGMFWGNLLGIGLALLQLKTGLFTLDEKSYYLSTIPIQIEVIPILVLNVVTFFVCMIVLLLPAMLVSRINPVNAIRFS